MSSTYLLSIFLTTQVFAVVIFSINSWLFYDAYKLSGKRTDLYKSFGFFVLVSQYVLMMIFQLVKVEEIALLQRYVLLIALASIIYGFSQEGIVTKPNSGKKSTKSVIPFLAFFIIDVLNLILSIFALLLIYRKVKKGFAKEYVPFARGLAFYCLHLALVLSLNLSSSNIGPLENYAAEFGWLWNLSMVFEFIALYFIARWILNYIRFRIFPQALVAFSLLVLFVATASALLHAAFLMTSWKSDTLERLENDLAAIEVSIDQQKDNSIGAASLISKSPDLEDSMQTGDIRRLAEIMEEFDETDFPSLDTLLVTNEVGEVLVSLRKDTLIGQSIAEDRLVQHALTKKQLVSSIYRNKSVLADEIEVKSTSPIVAADGSTLGIVQAGYVLDDAFADKIKLKTGLEIGIYSGDRLSATTIVDEDGKSRWQNAQNIDKQVQEQVLEKSYVYSGETEVLGDSYYSVYSPLQDFEENSQGMLFIGRATEEITEKLQDSIVKTFLSSIIIQVLAVIPAYYFAKFIEKNYGG